MCFDIYGAKGLIQDAAMSAALMASLVGVSGTAYHHVSLLQLEIKAYPNSEVMLQKGNNVFITLHLLHLGAYRSILYHGSAKASEAHLRQWPKVS